MKYQLEGRRFGRLTVLEKSDLRSGKKVLWRCLCDCGKEVLVITSNLTGGNTKSCGCLHNEGNRKTHGQCGTRLYRIWKLMKARCYQESSRIYKYYGGRGITVCDEWQKFEPFHEWAMANGYGDDLTIDRINVNGNYEPSNCRWATNEEQHNNTRRNVMLTYNGETMSLSQWAHRLNMPVETLWSRIFSYKWSVEKAISTPVA